VSDSGRRRRLQWQTAVAKDAAERLERLGNGGGIGS